MSNSVFNNRNTFSLLALIVIVVCEVVAILGIRWHCVIMLIYALTTVLVLCVALIIIGWFYGSKHHRFWPNKTIFTKLMANAISPSWLGALYLLLFIIHLGWLTDGSLNYFQSKNDSVEVSVSLITGFIAMLALVSFFPEGKSKKRKEKTKMFVSGISAFQSKPNPVSGKPVGFSKSNLIPLVRILQVAEPNCEKCEMLILKSSLFKDNVPTLCIDRAEELKLNVVDEADYNEFGIDRDNDIDDHLRLIIKKTALAVFLSENDNMKRDEKEIIEWIRNLKIYFTPPCDYDEYASSFRTLVRSLREYDSSDREFCFNLTPGTVVVSSIMTLLSIDSDRELYYYRQASNITDDRLRLQKVDKTKVPLENLLSQALETLKQS